MRSTTSILPASLTAALLLFFAAGVVTPADPKDWLELIGPDFDVWKGPVDGWALADTVELNAKDAKLLSFTKGQGTIVNGEKGRAPDLISKKEFGDVELHLEFLIPKGSNSGVKFHALYEIQIIDSYGVKDKDLDGTHCGGIYPRAEQKPNYHHIDKGIAPKVNACKEPGTWQTLDVIFVAARFDGAGKKTANAKIVKAILNGQVVHENQEMETPTGHNWHNKEMTTGPLLLQGDHGPVAFRNVRVRAYVSDPK
jgi:hypothetical protein